MPKGTCKFEGCEKPAKKRDWCVNHYHWLRYHGLISPLSALDRFMAKVVVNAETGCWEWTGVCDTYGYGRFWLSRKVPAHRWAYEHFVGPIPTDKPFVLHHCDNPPCVRADPDPTVSHLFLGTHQDNSDDKYAKGRDPSSQGTHASLARTHCPRGHPLSGDNVRWEKGSRACRTCRNAKERRRRARQRSERLGGGGS